MKPRRISRGQTLGDERQRNGLEGWNGGRLSVVAWGSPYAQGVNCTSRQQKEQRWSWWRLSPNNPSFWSDKLRVSGRGMNTNGSGMNTNGNCAMTSRFPAIGRPGSAKYLMEASPAPLLLRDDHNRPSVFRPENMLREARRQKGLPPGRVPPFCVLDPDGDIVRYVRNTKTLCARRPGLAITRKCGNGTKWESDTELSDPRSAAPSRYW
jgi:hypothetical protein